jgi:hypothetical protein
MQFESASNKRPVSYCRKYCVSKSGGNLSKYLCCGTKCGENCYNKWSYVRMWHYTFSVWRDHGNGFILGNLYGKPLQFTQKRLSISGISVKRKLEILSQTFRSI